MGKLNKNSESSTVEYRTWKGMIYRCHPIKGHKHYGLRGIHVCDRWINSYSNFLSDMGRKPTPKHSIDRIDVDAGYSPENCRWASVKEQSTNKRIHKRFKEQRLERGMTSPFWFYVKPPTMGILSEKNRRRLHKFLDDKDQKELKFL